MRYLAIDYGGKRTGLALCDNAEMIASPVAVVENRAMLMSVILDLVESEHVDTIVLGLPLNMDGSEGSGAKDVRQFARELGKHTAIPIIFHDERLSSYEAEGKLAGFFTRKKKKQRLDAVAAAEILQSFLDKKHEAEKFGANISVVTDYEELSRKALELFIESAMKAIEDRDVFYTAISGGSTPKRFFELIGESQESRGLPWDKIQLFWVDERCVGPHSDQSNYRLAADTFLCKVGIKPQNVHRIFGEWRDLEKAAREYENTMRDVFGIGGEEIPVFDLIFLGMGPDGHTASLMPGSSVINETKRLAAPLYLTGKISRITLTVPVLLAAAKLAVMISGSDKAETLKHVLNDVPDKMKYPIQSLWPCLDRITWLADEAAFQKAGAKE
jgi:6-phosphogluconolactonase